MNKVTLNINNLQELKIEISPTEIKVNLTGDTTKELKFSDTNELTVALMTLVNVLESNKLEYLTRQSKSNLALSK